MSQNLPPEIRALCRDVFDDPIKRHDFLRALEEYTNDLRSRGRIQESERYIAETIIDLRADAEAARKTKSRSRFRVVSTLIAPAFVTILTKVVIENLPLG